MAKTKRPEKIVETVRSGRTVYKDRDGREIGPKKKETGDIRQETEGPTGNGQPATDGKK